MDSKKITTPKKRDVVRQASANIFEDLKLPNAQELNAKSQIAYRICAILEERKLTQKEAASVLGVDQPKISALLRGRLEGFSTERLFRFLNSLDREIEIRIRPSRKSAAFRGIRVLTVA
jgi:predicted XRE-type DNA-binding protein